MTWRRIALVGSAGLLAFVGLYVGAPYVARRIPFFRVRRVEVVGLRYLHEADVVAALHLPASLSVIDPLASVNAAASRIPGVAAASVERRLPGTLRVTILEELPVALASHGGELVLVDDRGRALPFDPARQHVSLPIADSGAAPAALLARVMLSAPEWYAELDSATLEQGDVVLRIGSHRIRLRPDANEETLRAVLAVREYLSNSAIAWVEIDARYKGRVFVQKEAA